MTFREFELPDYHEFVDVLGVGPEAINTDEAQSLQFERQGEILVVTFDVPGRSLHCRWTRNSQVLVDLFRESAVRVHLSTLGEARSIEVAFEVERLRGRIDIQVDPNFSIHDRLLFQ